jgi:UDP-glucuronate 4-epimerase
MEILVTGAAGFIGMHTCKRLLEAGHEVIGLDSLNTYYITELKQYRLNLLLPLNSSPKCDTFHFKQLNTSV